MVSLENVESKKSKKAKKRLAEQDLEPTLEVTPTKKKKKNKSKKEETEPVEPEVSAQAKNDESDDSSEENLPFKKKFYSRSERTEQLTKEEVKAFHDEHGIVMYGKGRKKFKPVLTFEDLGFSKGIMKICAGFDNPTPIQVKK